MTDPKQEVDKLLKALNLFTSDKNWIDHSPILLVGSEATGEWIRTYALAPPSDLAAIITRVIESAAKSPSK